MKNRKLFAILTLVAFMMTLLPMAAFAATPAANTNANRHASILTIDTESVEADGDEAVKFTVYVRQADNEPVDSAVVYVASERGTTDRFFEDDEDAFAAGIEGEVAYTTDSNGKVVFYVKSKIAGDADIAVALDDQVAEYLTSDDVTAAEAKVIATKTITFEATSGKGIELVSAVDRDADAYDISDRVNNGTVDEPEYEYTVDEATVEFVKANNVDYYELKFEVTNDSGAPVEDETIELSANKSAVRFNKNEITTDEIGQAKVKVYASKPGDYKVEASVGGEVATVNLTFAAGEVYGIELVGSPAELVAIDEENATSFKLKFTDVSGNKVDPEVVIDELDDLLDFDWMTVPSGSDVDDNDSFETDFYSGSLADTTDLVSVTADNLLKVYLPELDEEGNYELRISLDSGKYVDVQFEGKEQGDITEVTLEYDQASIALGEKTGEPTVKRIDAAGVSVEATVNSDFEFSVNDYRLLAKDDDGAYILPSSDNDYVIEATDDDDYIGKTIVVTVVDTKEDLTATTEVVIGAEAMGLEVELPEGLLEVGEDANLTLNIVDVNGNTVALGSGVDDVELTSYITSKPAGAIVSVEAGDNFISDLKNKGKATVEVSSNKEGKVNVTLLVKVEDGVTVKYTFTKAISLNFGVKAPEVSYGASNVTLFIGSTGYVADGSAKTADQAPFIQDGRTFVPVRMVGEALGAEVEYDAATQVITLTRPDLTVTMTVGSNVLTLSDGSTVVADVAPFIVAETGRTVIPFRAIAEAFGADVEAVFAADGTVTAVTFAQ